VPLLPERAVLGQLFDLLRVKPPVCFRRCELSGAFEGCLRCVSLSKPTQRCAAGRVHQMIGVELGCIESSVVSAAPEPSVSPMAMARLSAVQRVPAC
jgi:hypothetical protein